MNTTRDVNSESSARSILLVVNHLGVGGAEIQVVRLAVGLRRRGWRVGVVSMLPLGVLAGRLREGDVNLYDLNMSRGVPNPLGILRLRQIIRKQRPDIVHSHIVHANILARMTRLVTPMRVLVCTAHNMLEGGRAYDLSYRYTDRLADLTTNVCQAAVDRYVQAKAAPANRIRFVPNGLDISRYRKVPEDRTRIRGALNVQDQFVWLAAGRFHGQKDYPNMLRAFAAASAGNGPGAGGQVEASEAILVLAGDGPLEGEIQKLAATLGIADRVRFLGLRSDIPQLMNAADGYVLSSAWEGMPLVLQEAGATGLPVVATRVGGNAEVVLDGVSGLLVSPGNQGELAAAMAKIMGLSQGERAAMGQAGRDYIVKRYDIENVLGEWERIYDELLASRPR